MYLQGILLSNVWITFNWCCSIQYIKFKNWYYFPYFSVSFNYSAKELKGHPNLDGTSTCAGCQYHFKCLLIWCSRVQSSPDERRGRCSGGCSDAKLSSYDMMCTYLFAHRALIAIAPFTNCSAAPPSLHPLYTHTHHNTLFWLTKASKGHCRWETDPNTDGGNDNSYWDDDISWDDTKSSAGY